MKPLRPEPIEKIRKRFKKEWLLIAVDKMDKDRNIPLGCRVIAHSPRRDDVYQAMLKHEGLDLVIYSEEALPTGYATAF
jgi:hypothetical protein